LKLESDKYCETKLFSKMDMYFETEEVYKFFMNGEFQDSTSQTNNMSSKYTN